MENISISGGISGAITDPNSVEAIRHANIAYGAIRKSNTDIEKIAQNTGYNKDQISLIKNYLFVNEHDLEGKRKQFDPDFFIAQSWHRLAYEPDNIKEHDLMLLKHELNEMYLITQGYSQKEAHDITNQNGFNYQKLCDEYYNILEENQNPVHKNSGAIVYNSLEDIRDEIETNIDDIDEIDDEFEL